MDWEKEPIINRVARRLPNKEYRKKMTVAELKAYFEMVYDEALSIHGVMHPLPSYKEVKLECEKQFKEMNETYSQNKLSDYEKMYFKSGFIRCFMFMKYKGNCA